MERADGSVTSVVEGTIDFDTYQRLDRPSQYGHESELIGEQAWDEVREDGTVLRGYRVLATPNEHPVAPEPQPAGARPGDKLARALEDGSLDEVETVSIVLRGDPGWTVPTVPPVQFLSTEDALAAHRARDLAISDRKARFAERSAPIRRLVEELGGVTSPHGWVGGVVTAILPSSSLDRLFDLPDVLTIERSEAIWRDAQFVLGEAGHEDVVGWDAFHVAGYHGEQSNASQHSFGDMTIAILEGGALEDEACFLDDSGCDDTGRLAARYDCEDWDGVGNVCESVSNFADSDGNAADHATRVTSIALAQYSEGQGEGGGGVIPPDDPGWIPKAQGSAPEAKVVFFNGGLAGYGPVRVEAAVEKAIELDVDAFSFSQEADSNCSVVADEAYLEAVENAYDSGIFFAACTGNGGLNGDPCTISDPGAIQRVFTVAGLGASATGCSTDYRKCAPVGWRQGGADATTPDNVTHLRALSCVDVQAPGNIIYATIADGAQGTIDEIGDFGCSFATPLVAGAAMAVKSQYLSQNDSWINGAGRLHTVMLMHTDRHRAATFDGTTSRATTGTSRIWGLGRAKLTPLGFSGIWGVNGRYFATTAFTAFSGDSTHFPWSSPLPSGTQRVKCVLFQAEDMSDGKTKISNLDLRLRLRNPNLSGTCNGSLGSTYASRLDDSFDTTSMVAFDTSDTPSMAGKCVEAVIEKQGVVLGTTITTHLACHRAWRKDDEPN